MTESITWNDLIADLERMKLWKDDYDGEGSKAPHQPSLSAAISMAKAYSKSDVHPANFVVATPEGDISFEWSNGEAGMEVSVFRIED